MPPRKSSNESVLLDGESVDCRMENGCLCFRVPPSLHEARAELCACIERAAASTYDICRGAGSFRLRGCSMMAEWRCASAKNAMALRKSSNESVLLDGAAVDCRMENGCLCFRVPASLHAARALSYALA